MKVDVPEYATVAIAMRILDTNIFAIDLAGESLLGNPAIRLGDLGSIDGPEAHTGSPDALGENGDGVTIGDMENLAANGSGLSG